MFRTAHLRRSFICLTAPLDGTGHGIIMIPVYIFEAPRLGDMHRKMASCIAPGYPQIIRTILLLRDILAQIPRLGNIVYFFLDLSKQSSHSLVRINSD